MKTLRRRDILRRGLQSFSALMLLPVVSARAETSGACVDRAGESLRNSMQYADPSPYGEDRCGACAFFTADGESSCGNCVIMSGPVSETGWCESWSPRG